MKLGSKIAEALIHVGFELPYKKSGDMLFFIGNERSKDFLRFFCPHVLYYENGKVVAGVLGSVDRTTKNYVITCYSSNFLLLRSPPIFGVDNELDIDWCKRVASVASSFPSTKDQLDALIELKGSIFDVPVLSMNLFYV